VINRPIRIFVLFLLWIGTIAVAGLVGLSFGQRSMLSVMADAVDDVQAKLLLPRIDDERHLADLLNNGCVKVASEHVEYDVDQDFELLHDGLKEHHLSDAVSYIRYHDPEVFKEAEAYSRKFPNPWQEPACNRVN
jgi:hypothetical protein